MAHPLRIQRKRTKGWKLPDDAVCVTRGTKYGNPFVGEEAVQAFSRMVRIVMAGEQVYCVNFFVNGVETYCEVAGKRFDCIVKRSSGTLKVSGDPHFVDDLRGKKLACFCSLDKPCHADVLAELANQRLPVDTDDAVKLIREKLESVFECAVVETAKDYASIMIWINLEKTSEAPQ